MHLASDPIGRCAVDLLVKEVRIPCDCLVTKAGRIEAFLRMVDFPSQGAQVVLLCLEIIDALRVNCVFSVALVQVVARKHQEFQSLVLVFVLAAVDL